MGEMKAYAAGAREGVARGAAQALRARRGGEPRAGDRAAGGDRDPEEEEFVKYALKKTLDNQVERKARDAVDEKASALREDQTTLNALAIEMRQSRFREMQDRNEQAEMLSATWTKQKALKDMERPRQEVRSSWGVSATSSRGISGELLIEASSVEFTAASRARKLCRRHLRSRSEEPARWQIRRASPLSTSPSTTCSSARCRSTTTAHPRGAAAGAERVLFARGADGARRAAPRVASPSALGLLGLRAGELGRPESAEYLCGNRILPVVEPAAHATAATRFGHFAGQLGDGATMYLGEVLNPAGERWELQLKGGGRTHYSRQADRKVLRLVAPRVPVLRAHARARRAHDARRQPRHLRHARRPRHQLRRQRHPREERRYARRVRPSSSRRRRAAAAAPPPLAPPASPVARAPACRRW